MLAVWQPSWLQMVYLFVEQELLRQEQELWQLHQERKPEEQQELQEQAFEDELLYKLHLWQPSWLQMVQLWKQEV